MGLSVLILSLQPGHRRCTMQETCWRDKLLWWQMMRLKYVARTGMEGYRIPFCMRHSKKCKNENSTWDDVVMEEGIKVL